MVRRVVRRGKSNEQDRPVGLLAAAVTATELATAGGIARVTVRSQLPFEGIVIPAGSARLAGRRVTGPFTALLLNIHASVLDETAMEMCFPSWLPNFSISG